MGMLDALKRWFDRDGERNTQQWPPPPPPRKIAPAAAAHTTPAPEMTAPAHVAPAAPVTAVPATAEAAPIPVIVPPAPVVKAASQTVRREAERRVKLRVNARVGTHVLIIDDSPTIVALLKRMLEQSGYTATEAGDAETGVAQALSGDPDLIFLDIVLPGMNGFEALRRLRRDPVTKSTPIIMISGNELATEQFYAQRIGADDFMKKPFSRSEVFARIEKLLDAELVPRRQVAVVALAAAIATPVQQTAAQ